MDGFDVAEHQVEQQILLLGGACVGGCLVGVVVYFEEGGGLVVVLPVPVSGAAFVLPSKDLIVVLFIFAGAV